MPDPGPSSPPSSPPGSRTGIGARAAAAAGSFLDYADVRIRLFCLEASEARGAVVRRLIAAAIGAFFLVIGYLGLLAGGVALLSISLERPWHQFALAVAVLHLLAAWFCLIYAKRQLRESPFRDSRREFEKDREWLNSMRPPKPRDR